jgi:hypothetical protein
MDDDIERIQEQDQAYDDVSNEDLKEPYDSGERELVGPPGSEPDVLLDVSELRVDEITLDVEDLRAHVSLQAEVLELLKLDVGADAQLGKVHLDIKGVTAQALLKVRLDRVAAIIGRVLTTIDRNPQILERVTSAVGSAARELGRGAGESVGELGRGAGDTVGELGRGAGSAVGDVGRYAGEAVGDVGETAGALAKEDVGSTVKDIGEAAGDIAGEAAEGSGQTADTARRTADKALGSADAGDRDWDEPDRDEPDRDEPDRDERERRRDERQRHRDERHRDERQEASRERGAPRRPTVRREQDRRRERRPP